MKGDKGDAKALGAVLAELGRIDEALGKDPEFSELAEEAIRKVTAIGERHGVAPIVVMQCLFNRAVKTTG